MKLANFKIKISSCSLCPSWFIFLLSICALQSFADPVMLTETDSTYTLSNGTLTAIILKHSGDLPSLKYNNLEMLNQQGGRKGGYWSHNASSEKQQIRISIDPKTNNGEIGEVSIKGSADGQPMGSGPGGSTICDIEIRYTLKRDDHALYTYSTFTHPSSYPATQIGEARFLLKLNDNVFDWMTIDAKRNKKMFTAHDWNYGQVLNMKEVRRFTTGIYKGEVEHKYDYSANQFDVLTWGWSSTKQHVGIWFINPTIEYLSGGPTKIELSAHRDATFNPDAKDAPAPPCLLNYWRGSHYGGTTCSISSGELWSKTIGPFAIYCNSLTPSPGTSGEGRSEGRVANELWHDALARQSKEVQAWPYDFVQGLDYPRKSDRAIVTGQLVLNDPIAHDLPHLRVGLTDPNSDWQRDAKHYEFWIRGTPDGKFTIPDIRPGTYTLHAISDSVLGEFTKVNIHLSAGQSLNLGNLEWKPVRYGKQLWDIGILDRTATEFFNGDRYNTWGLYNEYPKQFPHDVHFVIGKSDYHKDWNLMQVPRARDDTGRGRGDATTWTIEFNYQPLASSRANKATLRLAFAGTEARSLDIAVNGKHVETLTGFPNTSSIHRDSAMSYWQERDVTFDASLLKNGTNTIALTVPAGPVTAGVMYDYLRLEVAESSK